MCISFVYIGDDSSPESNGYQLIIVNNRDEMYGRPTKPADFWRDNPDCISGVDLERGREGGTWFGASRYGKIGMLLNILEPSGPNFDKQGRGHLVTDFLTGVQDATTYMTQVGENSSKYNLFNLLLFQMRLDNKWEGYYLSSEPGHSAERIFPGIHGVSNSTLGRPFQKVIQGKEMFNSIVNHFNHKSQRKQLEDHLFSLMADRTCRLPDPQLTLQGGERLKGDFLTQRSGIYVDSRQINYGTRTTTLFFADNKGCCEYIEKTMKEPVNPNCPEWDITRHRFNVVNVLTNKTNFREKSPPPKLSSVL